MSRSLDRRHHDEPTVPGAARRRIGLLAAILVGGAMSATSVAQTLTWNAGVDTNWDTATANWTGSTFANGNNVVFAGAGQGAVTVQPAGVQPATMAVSGGSYAFSGGTIRSGAVAQTGGSTIVAMDVGTLALTGTYSLTGGTLTLNNTAVTGNQALTYTPGTPATTFIYTGGTNHAAFARIIMRGVAEFNSGSLYFSGGIQMRGGAQLIDFNGATVTATSFTWNHQDGGDPFVVNMNSGSFATTGTGGVTFGGGTFQDAANPIDRLVSQFNMIGGTFTTAGLFQLGQLRTDSTRERHNTVSRGARLNMTGGILTMNNMNLGMSFQKEYESVLETFGSDGLWNQAGGVTTVNGTMTFQRIIPGDYNIPRGALEFVVGPSGTLVFTGAGMAASTTGAGWLLDTSNYNVAGTVAFAPAPATTEQTFLAFGADIGGGDLDFLNLIDTNFGIGTLDLSAIDGNEKLTIVGAGNVGTNALYVHNLLGLDLATNSPTLKHLDSALNIYYDASNPANSYLTDFPSYSLVSGGSLIGLNFPSTAVVPEPGSLALLALAALGLVARRRR